MEDRVCAWDACKRLPYYALEEGALPEFCKFHKSDNHVDIRKKSCEVEGCTVKPNYGFEGENPRFCALHMEEGMQNLSRGRCRHNRCLKFASCGQPGGSPEVCGDHKGPGMINLNGKRCSHPHCTTHASYGIEGTRPRYCAKHKNSNMMNLARKKCDSDGCLAQPTYNYSGQKKARFCSKHALEDMVEVLDRHCAQSGCDRQPIYGNSGEKAGKPTWCPNHRPSDSYDVKTTRCQEENCQKHPSYGFKDDRVRRRCRLHKLPGMVDVKSPKCERPSCFKQPCCGHLGAKARFCSEHKQEGMVNLKTRAFRCKHKDDGGQGGANGRGGGGGGGTQRKRKKGNVFCNRACRYAYPNEPAVYCAMHALTGMVDVLNPQCSMDDCLEIPTFGFVGEQPTFCMAHKAHGMQVIMPQSTNVLHWSSEARRQAAATALEAKRITSLREAGSAKVSTLPPKKDLDGLKKIQKAHFIAAKAVAAARGSEADAGSHDAGSSLVTPSDLALAFGPSMDDPARD
ncbi:unnamed protein product, partial [Scytosiphon promiscuus]